MTGQATTQSVTHSTFVIERTYRATPAQVFQAFADPRIKARWFHGPEEWGPEELESDFRVGGREVSRGGPEGEAQHVFEARYWDIVPDKRIVYSYDMHVGPVRISVSLATVELMATTAGTRLVFTEQGAYFDGSDSPADREHGSAVLLDQLGAELDRRAAGAGVSDA